MEHSIRILLGSISLNISSNVHIDDNDDSLHLTGRLESKMLNIKALELNIMIIAADNCLLNVKMLLIKCVHM